MIASSCPSQLMSIVFSFHSHAASVVMPYAVCGMHPTAPQHAICVIQSSAFGPVKDDNNDNNNNKNDDDDDDGNATRNRILFEAVIQIQTTLSPTNSQIATAPTTAKNK